MKELHVHPNSLGLNFVYTNLIGQGRCPLLLSFTLAFLAAPPPFGLAPGSSLAFGAVDYFPGYLRRLWLASHLGASL